MKKCPFCAEEIQDEAIKCKHCSSMIGEMPASQAPKLPWYFSTANLVVSFLCVGPFMLPLLWLHPKLSRDKKILFSVLIAAISAALGFVVAGAIKVMMQYFSILADPMKYYGG